MRNRVAGLPLTARYALAATAVLARARPGERLSSQELARRTGIPHPFLAKVLRLLRQAGLVRGVKGHGGGYQLARPAAGLRLGEIVDAGGEGEVADRVCVMGDRPCSEEDPCLLHERWIAASAPLIALLEQVSLGDLVTEDDGGSASRPSGNGLAGHDP